MWRVLVGIPRAIRLQIQSNIRQRPSCIDDEYKAQSPCYEVVHRQACGVTVTHRCSSSDSGSKNDHEQQGPDRKESDWRKPNFDFWSQLQYGRNSALEAVGWGTGVVLGIHLSKLSHDGGESCEGKRPCCRLLYKIAHTSPQLSKSVTHKGVQTSGSKSSAEETLQDKAQKPGEGPNALDLVFTEFEDLCRMYTATGNNIAGLQHAARKNMSAAVHHWKEASKLGCAKAQFNLGLCYESGMGVEPNLAEAVKQYSLAAASDHAEAVYNLALVYLQGGQGMEPDPDKGLTLMNKAAKLGLRQAQTYLGVHYTREENEDMTKAVKLFKAAAAQKDPEAQYFLGICYEQGWGTDQNECKAGELYREASAAGHDGAMYNLGVFHEYGMGGLPVNVEAATELYEQSAKAGNENASHSLERLQAEDLSAEWKRQDLALEIGEQTMKEPKSYLRSPASSPSLTEFLRDHLESLVLEPTPKPAKSPWVHLQGLANTMSYDTLDTGFTTPKFSLGQPDKTKPPLYYNNTGQAPHNPLGSMHSKLGRYAPDTGFTIPKFSLGQPDKAESPLYYSDTGQAPHNPLGSMHSKLVRPASLYDLRVACT
ncbi:DAP3-binding cell death enhancer 1-like [Liolophura sinensis]|uniref:DAP3-binding cell death enhancer 1-like n=1 Tax=Liolophura sinensis TaxID=3198878 RepID=UPI0031584B96